MYETVPSYVKPSGGLIAPLPAVPKQPKAEQVADAALPADGPVPFELTSVALQALNTPRLVPAKVGPSGRTQIIHIECPDWCAVDHMDRTAFLDDVMHYSDCDVVQVPTLSDDDFAHSELYANVSLDPSAADPRLRAAHIVVNDGGPEDAYLTPEMADELADDLITFAAQIRHQARIVRLHNQAGGQA